MKKEDKERIKLIKRAIMRLPVDTRRLIITTVGGTVYLRGRLTLMRTAPRGTDVHQVKQQLVNAVRRVKGVRQIMDQIQVR